MVCLGNDKVKHPQAEALKKNSKAEGDNCNLHEKLTLTPAGGEVEIPKDLVEQGDLQTAAATVSTCLMLIVYQALG